MSRSKFGTAWKLAGFFLWLPTLTVQQLPPWDNQLFDFGWEPYLPTIQQCTNINVHWGPRRTANPAPQPPYTLRVFGTGFKMPLFIDAGQGTNFNWQVNLPPTGGPYVVTMLDANGYTGGTSLVFDVTAGTSCGPPNWNANGAFSISHSPSTPQCGTLELNVNGGQAPYTLQAIVEETPPKTINITDAPLEYLIDIKAGLRFFLAVTDATGQTVVDGINTSANPGGSKPANCLNIATTVSVGEIQTTYAATDPRLVSYAPTKTGDTPNNSPTTTGNGNASNINAGAIAGGVVGGVALLAIVAFLLWRYFRQSAQTPILPPHFDLDGTSGPHHHQPYPPAPAPIPSHPHNIYSDASHHPGYTYQAVPHSPVFTPPMSMAENYMGMASGSHVPTLPPGARSPTGAVLPLPPGARSPTGAVLPLPPGAQSPTGPRRDRTMLKRDQTVRPLTPPLPEYQE